MNERKMPFIVAHRGASYAAPENTLPSFLLAFKEDADFIEGDFWLTEDNRIVCLHDKHTLRTAPNQTNMNVVKSTYEEMENLDFGDWKSEKFKNTRILLLEDLLKIIPEGKGIFIEIKDGRGKFLEELNNILRRTNFPHRLIRIISFDPKVITSSKKNFPDIKAYWIFEWLFKDDCNNMKSVLSKLLTTLDMINADGIDMNFSKGISGNIIREIKNRGYDFVLYDVNTPEDAFTMTKLGADALTTNYPAKIKKYLYEKFYK